MPLTASEAASPGERAQPSKGRPPPTPWAGMLRSPAVWAIVANNFAFHYAFYVVMNWLPTYFARRGPTGGARALLARAADRVALCALPRDADACAARRRPPPPVARAACCASTSRRWARSRRCRTWSCLARATRAAGRATR